MNVVLLSLAVVVGAPGAKDPPKKEPPSIVGEWNFESMIFGGTPMPAPEGAKLEFTKDGKCIAYEKADKPDESKYTVDAKKEPNEIDIKESGGMKDMVMAGIYKIEGDTLTICMSIAGDRPKTFESPANGNSI